MALEITIASILSFIAMTLLLLIYAVLDVHTHHVPNRIMIIGGMVSLVIVIITGHLFEHALLHLSAGAFMIVVAYTLFKTGAFGGADVKATITVTILSPGFEFGHWSDPILEGIVSSGLLLVIVLFVAYIVSQYRQKSERTTFTPLIPLMLVSYLALQLLALV
jgi:Flp pilus assembly protein protease CpaA